jgi:hypothetical protein
MIFHAPVAPFNKEKDGFYSVTFPNVPAFREEPRMPPEDQVRAWMLVYYTRRSDKETPQGYWNYYGKKVYEVTKGLIKVNDDIRRAATEAIGDAATPEQKLQRLFEYCRAKVKNAYDDASGFTDADREKMKKNNNPGDTLKRGMGTGEDISLLACLCRRV